MATSETGIANSALAKIGGARIISLNDSTREALLMKEQYDKIRQQLLRAHPWNFAIVRMNLAALVTTPAFKYSKQYRVPSDCLRVLDIHVNGFEWEKEGDLIVTDSPDLGIRYVKDVTEVARFDACFAECLAIKLAADVCYAITQSTTLKTLLDEEFKKTIQESRSFDGQEGGPKRRYANEWLYSRY